MRDELLAYLLDDTDSEQRRRIEHHLQHDPTWQHEFERLKKCLAAQMADPEESECPPEDLVNRTCSFVQEVVRDSDCAVPQGALPVSLSESRDGCAKSNRWSLTDLAIGVAIMLLLGTLLMPALQESRDAARVAKCQDNLREIGIALVGYAKKEGGELPHIGFHENAGMFVADLVESGMIGPRELAELLVCPDTQLADDVFRGKVVLKVMTREELARLSPQTFDALRMHMSGSFAFQFGYVDDQGKYRPMRFSGRSDVPMLADAPSPAAGFQSANHGGRGQNVLYQDLSCRFLSLCVSAEGGHVFLNEEGQHAAGCNPQDFVLGRSEASPSGLLQFIRD